jgi:uncharacterized protein (DUF1697 family)
MPRYIALLRAINVGGHTVKMDRLRALFGEMNFAAVETFIASGNVVFESPVEDAALLEERIQAHLQRSLGYPVATFVRSPAELGAVAAYRPFGDAELEAEGGALMVSFLASPPTAEGTERLMRHRSAIDEFHVQGREAYWLCRTRISGSAFSGALLERALGMPATMRNVTTVRKLAVRYPA